MQERSGWDLWLLLKYIIMRARRITISHRMQQNPCLHPVLAINSHILEKGEMAQLEKHGRVSSTQCDALLLTGNSINGKHQPWKVKSCTGRWLVC